MAQAPETLKLASEQTAAPADGRNEHRRSVGELARNCHRDLVRFLTARVGSRDSARELAQETYARVLALDRPDAVGFLAGYVWRTARNLATDVGIQKANRDRLDQLAHPSLERHAPSPEAAVYARQRLELLTEALEELRRTRPRCHEAFVLRIVEERSFSEVSLAMNIAQRNAMEHVAKALRHCQRYLDAAEKTGRRRSV